MKFTGRLAVRTQFAVQNVKKGLWYDIKLNPRLLDNRKQKRSFPIEKQPRLPVKKQNGKAVQQNTEQAK